MSWVTRIAARDNTFNCNTSSSGVGTDGVQAGERQAGPRSGDAAATAARLRMPPPTGWGTAPPHPAQDRQRISTWQSVRSGVLNLYVPAGARTFSAPSGHQTRPCSEHHAQVAPQSLAGTPPCRSPGAEDRHRASCGVSIRQAGASGGLAAAAPTMARTTLPDAQVDAWETAPAKRHRQLASKTKPGWPASPKFSRG
jgi:hypothetical protein